MSARGPGRPPSGDAADRKAGIIEAAREVFREKGFDAASMRGIAARAGVDHALVRHYFGTKVDLFIEAMNIPVDPKIITAMVDETPPGELGERLVRFALALWGRPEATQHFRILIGSAMTNDQAARMMREFFSKVLLEHVAKAVVGENARLRMSAVASQVVGMVIMRYIIKLDPLAEATDDGIVALIAPRVQSYIDGA